MNKKKVITDALLNIIANALPILTIQIIILPIIGRNLGEVQYGQVITLVSLSTLFSLPFGNVLNNIRLLSNKDYEEDGIKGDFNILLLVSIIINSFAMIIGTIYYEGLLSFTSVILMIILSGLSLAREYLIVSFRINLNFRLILINNLILGIGYLLGMIFFFVTGFWQFIYIFGSILSLTYIIRNSNLLKEKFTVTHLFKKTTYKSFILFLSIFMKTFLSYADKLLIYPLLGPTAVAIYYTSTVLGKIISMAITPISSVMLSYLAKMEDEKMNKFTYVLSFTALVGVFGYFAIIFISEPILRILYPNWAAESMKLIFVTTATAIIGVISSVVHPFILRFNNINWQIFINGANITIYLTSVIIFYNLFGLIGFSIGVLIASIFKLLLMISIYIYNYRKKILSVVSG